MAYDYAIKKAKDALLYFHNAALQYPENYRLFFDELIDKINQENPNFLDRFGKSIEDSKISNEDLMRGMQKIAHSNQGKLTGRYGDFFAPLQAQANQNMSLPTIFKEGAKESVVQAAKVSSELGKATVAGLTNSLYSLPLIIIGGLFFYIYMKGR